MKFIFVYLSHCLGAQVIPVLKLLKIIYVFNTVTLGSRTLVEKSKEIHIEKKTS